MSVPLKLANVWRVLRDVDLAAIRERADARFLLPFVADEFDDALRLRALWSPDGEAAPHPWIVPVRATDGLPPLPQRALLGVLLSRAPELSSALVSARDGFGGDDVGVITAVIDADVPPAPVPAFGEATRLTAPAVDSGLARDLAAAVVRAAGPDWRLALARQLPPLRTAVIDELIEETAQANASYALATGVAEAVPLLTAPMNLGDVVVLTKNQLVMSYRIALACGLEQDPRRLMPEIVGVLGGGLILRQIARQLVGLLPIIGIAPKVAVAYGGTYAIGHAIAAWASDGREASRHLVRRWSQDGLARGRVLARSLRSRDRRSA